MNLRGTRADGPYRKNVDYDSTLWRKALHKAFPNSAGKRTTVFTTASHVRSLRNRAAQHEPLFDGVPSRARTTAAATPASSPCPTPTQRSCAYEYIDQDDATWLGQTSRVPELPCTRP
ncbi:hypothetical protein ACFRIC_16660 [Streptomyces sp. NPDC056738]|uniref:hypothetical protein n=1 Tax=Streptomyces sp. NPDC056738 TaxID=3345933 RepID=UPI0036B39B0D